MVQARHHLGLTEREKKFTKELKPYHNSSSPSSSSLVNALKHSYKSIGSVCIFLLLSTLSCSVKTFSCELWYLRCSVVGSHSIAMYELLEPNSCSLHFITHPWQNLIRKYGHFCQLRVLRLNQHIRISPQANTYDTQRT